MASLFFHLLQIPAFVHALPSGNQVFQAAHGADCRVAMWADREVLQVRLDSMRVRMKSSRSYQASRAAGSIVKNAQDA